MLFFAARLVYVSNWVGLLHRVGSRTMTCSTIEKGHLVGLKINNIKSYHVSKSSQAEALFDKTVATEVKECVTEKAG